MFLSLDYGNGGDGQGVLSFHENEIDGEDQATKSCEMVPVKRLTVKQDVYDDGEDDERNDFLNNFELYKRERTAITVETNTVGRDLKGIFCQGDEPREKDYGVKWPVGKGLDGLQTQVAVPS